MFSQFPTGLKGVAQTVGHGLTKPQSLMLNQSGPASTGMAWLGIIGKLTGQPGANASEAVLSKNIITLGEKYKAGNLSGADIAKITGGIGKPTKPTEIAKVFSQLIRVYDAINNPDTTSPSTMAKDSYNATSGAPLKHTEQSLTDTGTIEALAGMRPGQAALLIGPHPDVFKIQPPETHFDVIEKDNIYTNTFLRTALGKAGYTESTPKSNQFTSEGGKTLNIHNQDAGKYFETNKSKKYSVLSDANAALIYSEKPTKILKSMMSSAAPDAKIIASVADQYDTKASELKAMTSGEFLEAIKGSNFNMSKVFGITDISDIKSESGTEKLRNIVNYSLDEDVQTKDALNFLKDAPGISGGIGRLTVQITPNKSST